jgi:hypothetical protein
MNEPVRIQLRRVKGWRMPPNTVSVARPTKWGNPFRIGEPSPKTGEPMSAAEAVAWYRMGLWSSRRAWTGQTGNIFRPEMAEVYDAWEARTPHLTYTGIELRVHKLRGKNLACWCPLDQPCHADVLLEMANA